MNFSFTHLLPAGFGDDSRVWIYQSSRSFITSECLQVEAMLHEFVKAWKTHGAPVKGYAGLLFGQFIILMADEAASGVSGCSIDSSVRVLQQVEQQFKTELFNWQNLAFIMDEKVQVMRRNQFKTALENNSITPQTLFFNNVVATKKELENNWIIPVQQSWLKTKLRTAVQ